MIKLYVVLKWKDVPFGLNEINGYLRRGLHLKRFAPREIWSIKTLYRAHEHKKITIKLYQNHDFHPWVEILGVGSIEQCDFAKRPRHGICIDIEVQRPFMGHILRKNS